MCRSFALYGGEGSLEGENRGKVKCPVYANVRRFDLPLIEKDDVDTFCTEILSLLMERRQVNRVYIQFNRKLKYLLQITYCTFFLGYILHNIIGVREWHYGLESAVFVSLLGCIFML